MVIEETAGIMLELLREHGRMKSYHLRGEIIKRVGNDSAVNDAAKYLRDSGIPVLTTKGRWAEWWIGEGEFEQVEYERRVLHEFYSEAISNARALASSGGPALTSIRRCAIDLGMELGYTATAVELDWIPISIDD